MIQAPNSPEMQRLSASAAAGQITAISPAQRARQLRSQNLTLNADCITTSERGTYTFDPNSIHQPYPEYNVGYDINHAPALVSIDVQRQ